MLDTVYVVKDGQSKFDVCNQTYGNVALLFKMLQDNKITNSNTQLFVGTRITFDSSIIYDNSIYNDITGNSIYYITGNFTPSNFELRDDGGFELRDDGGRELR